MTTQPASNRMFSIIVLYDMHTKFLESALAGITDDDAHKRLGTKANHVAWLTGSIVQERFEIAKALGIDKQQTAHELFDNNKGIQDDVTYPSLEVFKKDWQAISAPLHGAFQDVKDEKLDETFEMMPEMKMTYFELITFITYREANIIGQIALWRRLLGYEPMKYM